MWRSLRRWGDGRRWPRFALWALIGAFVCLVPLTLGSVILLAPVVLVVLVVCGPLLVPVSPGGGITGLGLPLLYVAYVNQGGPGYACTGDVVRSVCSQHVDPVPWLVTGTALVLVGLALELWARSRAIRRRRTEPRPTQEGR